MSSKPGSARSIASQLVILFTLAATLLLCCGFAIFYVVVIRHALEEDNEMLADKMAAVRADLERAHGPQLLADELNLPRKGERVVYWVRVLDAAGKKRAEAGMHGICARKFFRPRCLTSRRRRRNFAPGGISSPWPVRANRSIRITSFRWRRIDRATGNSRAGCASSCSAVALGALASVLIAVRVTRRGLRPLVDMTQALERVGPKRLHERVPPAGWPRELQPLVVAFDQMLDRLEDSFTRLSQFSADLAHELRTPIANLRGESEVALTRPRTTDEYREVIESGVAECERLSGIIENLLFLARAEAADGPVERKVFDGRSAVQKIISYYESVAEEHGITLSLQGDGEIYADQLLFSRALGNLVENALRYTPDGGKIAIALQKSH